MLIGCSNHNFIAILRKTNVPKQGSKVMIKRSYKWFDQEKYIKDITNAEWSNVFLQTDPEKAFCAFNETLMKIVDYHAPINKFTVRNANTPWLELKEYMKERDQDKLITGSSNFKSDWQVYCKLRNVVSKLNKKKKKKIL